MKHGIAITALPSLILAFSSVIALVPARAHHPAASLTQHAYIKASNSAEGDYFGDISAIAISGETLVIGAPLEDSSATGIDGAQGDDSAIDAGAAYVFVREGTNWVQQ